MYPNLTPTQRAALSTAARASHSIRINVDVLKTDHTVVGDIDHLILEGQVNVNLDAEVTHSASLTFFDPLRQLNFDSKSPADGALFADRMLRITYGVRLPGLADKWIDVPIFTGPVTHFTRNAHTVVVECQGKERLTLGHYWATHTYKKGAKKRDIIVDILRDEGERHFSMASPAARAGDVKMKHDSVPWTVCKQLAASMSQQLFYDGAGRARLRPTPGSSSFIFTTGDNGTILGEPVIVFDVADVKNAVQVTGAATGTGKKKKPAPVQRVIAPSTHPLSPTALGRNGAGRVIAEFVTDSAIKTQAAAKARANARLRDLLLQQVNVTCEAMVVPHLEPGDIVTIVTPEGRFDIRLRSYSIPLTADGVMSIGQNRRVTPKRRSRGTLLS